MPKIPVMRAVAEILASEGVDTAFGCPGAAILPLYQELERHGGIEHLVVRHEEGATHMADGWARTTGNVGVAIGTSGPAGTNMITGLYTAQADSIPILCITGQAASPKLHQEAFQAVDIVAIAKPVTKWAVQVREAAQVPWVFREAFRIARSGRPGPVLIDLPVDVQKQEIEWDSSIDCPLPVPLVTPHQPRVERALDLLLAAERPVILAGGGVVLSEATDQLRELAERLGVPVQVTLMGKGSFPEDHELFAGMAGIQTSQRWANAAFLEADLVLALGARFGDRHTGELEVYRGDRKFIHVDIEPTQLGKVFGPDLGIVSDIGEFLKALLTVVRDRELIADRGVWVKRIGRLKQQLPRRADFDTTPIKAPRVFSEINELFGEDTYFVTAIGLYQIWSGQFQRAHKPRHYQVCGQAGPLGWEIPAAIGVKMAKPHAEVVGIVGDYSFQFLVEELAVAAQYDVPFVLIMLNNTYLGLIRQAERGYDMNYQVDIHYDRRGTDNVKIMNAYGCTGTRVVEPGEIRPSIEWARKEAERTNRPVLVEIMIERTGNAAMGTALDNVVEFEGV
ncbi:glyoxylate carboligase [Amycolatopsis sp. K13G38]|uniref:Glyoxylate carboligase n=1 Tax=Amycolatopsis acididurans TaxID=2724524 RepID=A0ABX1JAZ6_9PSEU|nr:glyoxylate carboligase [Amycolatopsis acididurans]NKQ56441.1 glyoxylate carboligase [Amycolatopsis acididurans]